MQLALASDSAAQAAKQRDDARTVAASAQQALAQANGKITEAAAALAR